MAYLHDERDIGMRPARAQIVAFDTEARREMQRRTARRTNGYFQSWKLQRSVPWRFRDERDLLAIAELDQAIDGYEVTPERVTFDGPDGKEYWHVPSLIVRAGRRVAILDAVPSWTADRNTIIAIVRAAYARRGIPYRALTGSEIRIEPRFRNVSRILEARRFRPEPGAEAVIEHAVATLPKPVTIRRLMEVMPNIPEIPLIAFGLVLKRLLDADLSAPEADDMVLSLRPVEAA